jgi:hypothetical protein
MDTSCSCYIMNPDGYFLVDLPKSRYSGQLLHDESGWILLGWFAKAVRLDKQICCCLLSAKIRAGRVNWILKCNKLVI